jgi:apolipoprotein N-acyltransferase
MASAHTHQRYPQSDRFSLLWLGLGLVATWFSAPAWTQPLAPWLAGIFMLRFFRTQPLWRAILLQWPSATLGFIPAPASFAIVAMIIAGLIGLTPYLLDRWAAPYLPTALRTLVFPIACVSLDYAFSFAVTGTISSIAYTQFSVGPLMQLAAVAGIWPIVFLINWTATVVNATWEQGRIWPGWRSPLGAWVGVMMLVLVAGGLRLALAQPGEPNVKVAGIALDTLTLGEATYTAQTGNTLDVPLTVDYTSPELQTVMTSFGAFFQNPDDPTFAPVRAEIERLNNELFNLSRREAQAGAQIVAWSEANAYVLKRDEPAFIARGQQLARDEGIYLLMAMVTLTPGQDKIENKVVTIDPQGQIAATYFKNKLPPGENSVQGDGIIPVIDTPYGRLAAVICYDMDSPDFIRQLGRQDVDLVIAGSGDWKAIMPWHAHVAVVRSIENGFALVRPVRNGLLVHADRYGRIIDSLDYFTAQERVLTGAVSARSTPTLYPFVGDAFAVLAVASCGAVVMTALFTALRRALTGRRQARPAAA